MHAWQRRSAPYLLPLWEKVAERSEATARSDEGCWTKRCVDAIAYPSSALALRCNPPSSTRGEARPLRLSQRRPGCSNTRANRNAHGYSDRRIVDRRPDRGADCYADGNAHGHVGILVLHCRLPCIPFDQNEDDRDELQVDWNRQGQQKTRLAAGPLQCEAENRRIRCRDLRTCS